MKVNRHQFLFALGTLARFIGLFSVGSYYLNNLFIPFLDYGVTQFPASPWANFPANYFPYGISLYVILFIPKFLFWKIFGAAALGNTFLSQLAIKLPLFAIDYLCYRALALSANKRDSTLLGWYWLNPVLIYITYYYGQLDLVSMAFTIIAATALTKERVYLSAVFMACAVSAKFHVMIAVPFLLIYIWNRRFLKDALITCAQWLIVFLTIVAIGFIPLWWAHAIGYASLNSPEAFRIFAMHIPLSEHLSIYIGVMAVCAALGRLVISTQISEKGLIYGLGFLFGTLLLVTDPMPGWYFWFLPFGALFCAEYVTFPRSISIGLLLGYFLHFLVVPQLSLSPELTPLVNGLSLSLLQVLLAAMLVGIWIFCLRREAPLERRIRPLFIGIAGDSGVGKNRFSENLLSVFDTYNTMILEGDDYHRWERGHENWEDYTHLNPRANHLLTMAEHLQLLSQGLPVLKSKYDHSSGKFTIPEHTNPNRTVIVQGLHSLYLRKMRGKYDLKVFIEADPLVRMAWKLKRDVGERGHDHEKVLETMRKRKSDSDSHINPQRDYADWVIESKPSTAFTEEQIIQGAVPEVYFRHVVWNDSPIGSLVEELKMISSLDLFMDLEKDNIDRIGINIRGTIQNSEIAAIASRIFYNLRHVTRAKQAPVWKDNYEGINQLFALALLNTSIINRGV